MRDQPRRNARRSESRPGGLSACALPAAVPGRCTSAPRWSSRAPDPDRSDRPGLRAGELRPRHPRRGASAASRSGASSTISPTTRCAPTCCSILHLLRRPHARMQLGSMVVVLPWHDPMRVAEQVAMLDHMSNGRVILGLGRGLGRVEFEGFGVDMSDSREHLRRVGADAARRPRERRLRVRRQAREAGAPRDPPAPVQSVPRPHLRRRRVARVGRDHGASSASAS